MPIPMPYYLEKGPFFAVLEDYLNSGPAERVYEALEILRAGDGLEAFDFLRSPALENPSDPGQDWVAHLNEDWFGKEKQTDGTWKQPDFDLLTNPDTGYWLGYYGDVDSIVRLTLQRAFETALGLDHGEKLAAKQAARRHWPIEFLWHCSQSWFEGWVTWRRHTAQPDTGQVTVLWCTPTVKGSVVLDSPLEGRKTPEYRKDPDGPKVGPQWHNPAVDADQGMWVVTHTCNTAPELGWLTTTLKSKLGEWVNPLPGRIKATGEIVTVATAMADGGVLAKGLPYVPPPPPT